MKMTRQWGFLILLVVLAFLVVPAQAAIDCTICTLTNDNSTLTIDAGSSSGAYDWFVDATDVLYQQWFWYRIGNTGDEQPVNTLGLFSAVNSGSVLALNYGSITGTEIQVTYLLTGGTSGSLAADVNESIAIKNHNNVALDFHFFQYSDFDLAANHQDRAKIYPVTGGVSVVQTPVGSGPMLSETVANPAPNHVEVNLYANTLNKFADGLSTTLDDVSAAGPGDITWAFEWDMNIAARGTVIISKDKRISAFVPEPATILGLGTVLLLVGRKLSKRLA
jgi:hypothetical protein